MANNDLSDEEWIEKRGDKAKRRLKPVYLEKQQREGWTAELPLYLMWCDKCKLFSITHPAGYGRISCKQCRHTHRIMTWPRMRDKYLKPIGWRAAFFASAVIAALAITYL